MIQHYEFTHRDMGHALVENGYAKRVGRVTAVHFHSDEIEVSWTGGGRTQIPRMQVTTDPDQGLLFRWVVETVEEDGA